MINLHDLASLLLLPFMWLISLMISECAMDGFDVSGFHSLYIQNFTISMLLNYLSDPIIPKH